MTSNNPISRFTKWPETAIALAVALVFGSMAFDLNGSNATLAQVKAAQSEALKVAKRSEGQMNALASGVQRLADGGNQNARLVVTTLQQNGVSINANAKR